MNTERWVLVTGGAKRLGREICLAFAKANWHVICHHNRSNEQALETQACVQALGQQCVSIGMDLSATDAAEMLMEACQQKTGVLPHCILNNASIFEADEALTSTASAMQNHYQINTVVPLLLGNTLGRRLQGSKEVNGHYSVIHVLDQKVHNLNPDYFSYTVSKLALERSVALQAQALAPKVRVCGLSPGLIYLSGPQSAENFDKASQINLLRRQIDPIDVARGAVFLAENTSLTGFTLQTDNGQHLVPLQRDVMFAIETGKTS